MDLTFEKHILMSIFLTMLWIILHNTFFPFDATPLPAIGVAILSYAYVTWTSDEMKKMEEQFDKYKNDDKE